MDDPLDEAFRPVAKDLAACGMSAALSLADPSLGVSGSRTAWLLLNGARIGLVAAVLGDAAGWQTGVVANQVQDLIHDNVRSPDGQVVTWPRCLITGHRHPMTALAESSVWVCPSDETVSIAIGDYQPIN
ncbi:hypothetical protein KGA66_15995 [Actinocrinis puniceicyclus]|uniref:Uncharacterized protein n=1 Tax=Actinocrinis puniceicyclus TaxID=977794 RepID=A0A8J7WLH0_9ACTN|nr:hypothetical protein [Actinocrinis puniceicyclus]MBS2964558.1 hypothetical protein [Actinocrinis puniceicyclus]